MKNGGQQKCSDKGLIDNDEYPAKPATAISKISIDFTLLLIKNFFTLSEKVTKRQCQQQKIRLFGRW